MPLQYLLVSLPTSSGFDNKTELFVLALTLVVFQQESER